MSPHLIGFIGIVAFFLLVMLLRMPIAFSFAIVGFIGISILKGLGPGLSLLGTIPYSWASNWNLVCIPLFLLMGQLAFQAASKWVGALPGGLALATTLACTGFAACTGSSLASAATMGTLAYPEMKKFKCNDRWATGCIAAGGTLGVLIPPSTLFIIYGVITKTSISRLFMAGILPGLMISGLFLTLIFIMFKRNPALGLRGTPYPWQEKFVSLKDIWGMIVLFVLVMGGLYIGAFTPSEAGAIGSFGAFMITVIMQRLNKHVFISSLKETMYITCFILTVLIGAMIFSTFLLLTGLPTDFGAFVVNLPIPHFFILISILLFYIPLGCMIDALPMILLTVPIVFPVIKSLGFDPIWFGVIIVVLSELSLITPPVGMNLYVVQGVTNAPLNEVIRGIIPFAIIFLIGIVILVAFPQISLFIPNMMK